MIGHEARRVRKGENDSLRKRRLRWNKDNGEECQGRQCGMVERRKKIEARRNSERRGRRREVKQGKGFCIE